VADLNFFRELGDSQLGFLQSLLDAACHQPPDDWVTWHCGNHLLGYLSPDRAQWLAGSLPASERIGAKVQWHAGASSIAERSAVLQTLLERARDVGLVPGWRNEKFSHRLPAATANANAASTSTIGRRDTQGAQPDDPEKGVFLQVERAGFRFLGMRSEAVHINGFTEGGQLWCGRRSLAKPTDPGMLDNLSAGGLPCGETLLGCAVRELEEEAGFTVPATAVLRAQGSVLTARLEPQGWHEEVLHVFNMTVPAGFVPVNRDGEVAEFVCLGPDEALRRLRACEFTPDAAIALALGARCVG
jgi:8-oxo-dGTP pyrophosphatase MutT (NUDIX family)